MINAEYRRLYREKNLEKCRAWARRYVDRHREEYRARGSEFYYRDHEKTKKEKREYGRKWNEEHPGRRAGVLRAWRQRKGIDYLLLALKYKQNNPEKARAHHAVANAIITGRLMRPCACSCCEGPGRIEAHHDDYSKPLDVTWLCKKCHSQLRRIEIEELT